jgi:beta-glucosidase
LDKHTLGKNEILQIEVDIKNTSDRAGAEIVQLYIAEVQSTVERPPMELKGFEKIKLKAGESKTIKLTVQARDLAYFDEVADSWKANAGKFEVKIAASSRDIRLSSSFSLEEDLSFS